MTEYELSDLLVSSTGNATPILAPFITTISAYLITAWLPLLEALMTGLSCKQSSTWPQACTDHYLINMS
jgi:hypothetical protein